MWPRQCCDDGTRSTLPATVARVLGVHAGDTLVFDVASSTHGRNGDGGTSVTIRAVPTTYAGALTGVYGTSRDVQDLQRLEHAAWAMEGLRPGT